jgi:general secretion pathway protein B
MSYILDALKRADAERDRGQVPGLHAHPLGEGSARTSPGASRWALWGGLVAGAIVLAALAWRMGADANAPVPVAAQQAPAVVATPAPVAVAPAPAVTPKPAPIGVAPDVSSYAPPPAAAAQRPAKEARPATMASSPAVAVPPVTKPGAAAASPAPASSVTAAPAAARIPLLSELPSSLRQQLPALKVSGSVYSDDAASRFIMLNGDVVKEGAQPAPELVVERIEPRSAVLRFKGERFRLPY